MEKRPTGKRPGNEEMKQEAAALSRARKDKEIAAQKRAQEDQFAGLSTPTEQANYNIELFMRKRFLDQNGQPDRTKTPLPMPLPGFGDRSAMHARAERVPGLETHSEGRGGERVLVIGWDCSAVFGEASKIDAQARAAHYTEQETAWGEKMAQHQAFVKQHLKASRTGGATTSDPAVGFYMVRCTAIEGQWDDTDDLSLTILPRGKDGLRLHSISVS